MRVFVSQLPSVDRFSDENLLTIGRLADSLGFDGIALAPAVGQAGLNPNTSLLQAGILARETSRVKIGVLGISLPALTDPAQTADQLAWLQNASKGRLIAGLQLGTVHEYEQSRINPAQAPAMFAEAIELIDSVWNSPEAHRFDGQFWPRRLPAGRPVTPPVPLWFTGPGEKEFLQVAASRGEGYVAPALLEAKAVRKAIDSFRKQRRKLKEDDVIGRTAWQVPIYVGESDDQAWAEFLPRLEHLQRESLGDAFRQPPGLYSPRTIAKQAKAAEQSLATIADREILEQGRYVLVGSARTVRQQLAEARDAVACDDLIGLFQIGNMPVEKSQESIRRFARDVLGHVRNE